MKFSKMVISMLLVAIMVLSNFAGLGGVDFDFAVEADAAADSYQPQYDRTDINTSITLTDPNDSSFSITQKRIVSNHSSTYSGYQNRFFNGVSSNSPTDFVVPGLTSADDYTPQGMTYWEAKEWILISAYHAGGTKPSVIYALDIKTTKLVAVFKIYNENGTVNLSHGGGIAASEYNFYYADDGSKISYLPLSEMDVQEGTVKNIRLKGSIDLRRELNGVATSYCCYSDGILWTGNFVWSGDDRYSKTWTSKYPSVLMGYKLKGDSSAEEWQNLLTSNLLIVNSADTTQTVVKERTEERTTTSTDENGNEVTNTETVKITEANMNYVTSYATDTSITIDGSIVRTADAPASIGEMIASFATINLVEGHKYIIEYTANNNSTDMYMFSPGGLHCNVKQSADSTIIDNGDGTYTYRMVFTAGLRPTGADSSWPTTQSTDGSFTGTYTIRFDQDTITADRNFKITGLRVYDSDIKDVDNIKLEHRAGEPSYVVPFNDDLDRLQYAMVYDGKIYLSRSWSRNDTGNHIRELCVGDFDINVPGVVDTEIKVNGINRPLYVVEYEKVTKFGGDPDNSNKSKMFFMSEALCMIDDYLYMFSEGAAWAYYGKDGTAADKVCDEPIDVIWKIDQHKLLNVERGILGMEKAVYYEKVDSLSKINTTDDYLIVHESREKDPVTQKPVLYCLDTYGGYGERKLPKHDESSQKLLGDSMGVVGYAISRYSENENEGLIFISEEDSLKRSIHWNFTGVNDVAGAAFRIINKDLYYAQKPYLYFGSRTFAMSSSTRTSLDYLHLESYADGNAGDFRLYYQNGTNPAYYLWCNDGADQDLLDAYTNYYSNHPHSDYSPNYEGMEEVAGTFHADATYAKGSLTDSGNITGAPFDSDDNQIIHIYRRVKDPYGSVSDSRIYTDLKANLQADGTYNLNLETYAVSPYIYKQLDNERPTDFIFVVDNAEYDMNKQDVSGWEYWDYTKGLGTGLAIETLTGKSHDDCAKTTENGLHNGMYFKDEYGEYCELYCDLWQSDNQGGWISKKYYCRVWIYYTDSKGTTHWYVKQGQSEFGTWQTTKPEYSIQTGTYGKAGDRADEMWTGMAHYTYKTSGVARISAIRGLIEDLSYKLSAANSNHRMAVVTYGSDSTEGWINTGVYSTAQGSTYDTAFAQYSGTALGNNIYQGALFTSSQFPLLRECVNGDMIDYVTYGSSASDLGISKGTYLGVRNSGDAGDPDTYANYGMEMANAILDNSGSSYFEDGDRSACIIFLSTSVPGNSKDDTAEVKRVSDATINLAYEAKINKGAYIYSLQYGDVSDKYPGMHSYLEYVSSTYPTAVSMDETGDRNVSNIKYKDNVETGDAYNQESMINNLMTNINLNSKNVLSKIDDISVLREKISDAFSIPENAEVSVQTADAYYDGIDRLVFKDGVDVSSNVSVNVNRDDKSITVSGFDYMEHYVATTNQENAKKLTVSIKGVLANEEALLTNTNINDTESTAIYEDNTMTEVAKRFPTYHFNIPEYTYVLDYGLPMRDVDIDGSPLAVSSTLSKQDVNNYNTSLNSTEIGIDIENNDNLIYSLKPNEDGNDVNNKGYVLVQRPEGTYDWFRINVVPASNVMYEEDTFTDDSSKTLKWASSGTPILTYQSLTSLKDVYGYEKAFEDNDTSNGTYSNGTVKSVTLDSTNKRSNISSFTFTGTGIDVMSSCGSNTGALYIAIKDASNKLVKFSTVDTYYNDTYGTLTQVPVYSVNDLPYGTYTIGISGYYLSTSPSVKSGSVLSNLLGFGSNIASKTAEVDFTDIKSADVDDFLDDFKVKSTKGVDEANLVWMDDNSVLNGGSGVKAKANRAGESAKAVTAYLDGIRIYNPMYNDATNYIASEQGATYYNVVKTLANTNADDLVSGASSSFMGYFAPVQLEEGETAEEITFANYMNSSAPKDEVYLTNTANTSIAFNVMAPVGRVMVSMRAAAGSPVAKIGDKEFAVSSATEMYYDITDCVQESGGYLTYAIQNIGSDNSLLSVNNIKIVSGAGAHALSTADIPQVASLMSMESQPFAVNEQVYTPKYPNNLSTETEPETPDFSFGTDDEFVSTILEMLFDILKKIVALIAA